MEFEELERPMNMTLKIPHNKPLLNLPSFGDLVEESGPGGWLVEVVEKERLGLGVALALEEGK